MTRIPAAPAREEALRTLLTLLVGAAGAGLGWLTHLPVWILTGPAILISALGVLGVKFAVAPRLRDVAFLMIGIGLGAGVTEEATDAVLRWPLAFAALGAMLTATLILCRRLLMRVFAFDGRSAVLASTPGHLSFVLAIGAELNADLARIAVVQAVRLLALTLVVPLIAAAFGVTMDVAALSPGAPTPLAELALLFVAAAAVGLLFLRLRVPAALLVAGLAVSALAHLAGLTAGAPPPAVALPCFLVIGCLIGTRFSGISFADLRRAGRAGLATTGVALGLTLAAAAPVAWALQIPVVHVLVAFSPGGLETMIAMGAVLGANPGFIAACHIGRLLLLTVLTPLMLRGPRA